MAKGAAALRSRGFEDVMLATAVDALGTELVCNAEAVVEVPSWFDDLLVPSTFVTASSVDGRSEPVATALVALVGTETSGRRPDSSTCGVSGTSVSTAGSTAVATALVGDVFTTMPVWGSGAGVSITDDDAGVDDGAAVDDGAGAVESSAADSEAFAVEPVFCWADTDVGALAWTGDWAARSGCDESSVAEDCSVSVPVGSFDEDGDVAAESVDDEDDEGPVESGASSA
ncbi:hypothetical protein [Mycolicibacterium sp.]|uniref:hypothetical protein n=1 Tax=Mycolicibacterium sp. TaxID=2320850 RepID=UPI001A2BF429|nr:hypothetical protein [Mycolicibacterium sp.]MBJ7340230.1 hypothetical protein [Mycolicibacterium sp.]